MGNGEQNSEVVDRHGGWGWGLGMVEQHGGWAWGVSMMEGPGWQEGEDG